MNGIQVHAILVKAVRDIQSTNDFMDDMWMTYCHDWNDEPLYNNGYLSRDPNLYPTTFLGQFMQHAANHYNNKQTYNDFLRRKICNIPRLDPRYLELELRGVHVKRIWICVGQAELDEWHGQQSISSSYHQVRVKLGTTSVVHSGSAVAMFVHSLDSGLFSKRLGCTLEPFVKLNCLHLEGKFDKYPLPGEYPHLNRMDNVNNVLRAFGVDAGSTQRIHGKYEGHFLDPRLEHFVAVGTRKYGVRPCFDIVPGQFIKHLTQERTKVLQDANFVKQVVDGNTKENGVNRWTLATHCDVMNELMCYYAHDDPCTVVVHLHPKGTALTVDDEYVYNPVDA